MTHAKSFSPTAETTGMILASRVSFGRGWLLGQWTQNLSHEGFGRASGGWTHRVAMPAIPESASLVPKVFLHLRSSN